MGEKRLLSKGYTQHLERRMRNKNGEHRTGSDSVALQKQFFSWSFHLPSLLKQGKSEPLMAWT